LRGLVLLWPPGAIPRTIGQTAGRFRLGFWSTRMRKEKYAPEVISSLPEGKEGGEDPGVLKVFSFFQ